MWSYIEIIQSGLSEEFLNSWITISGLNFFLTFWLSQKLDYDLFETSYFSAYSEN